MSKPIRYNIKPGEEGYEIAVSLGGEWVHYSDYARLKAEVERLKNNCDYLDQKLDEEIERSASFAGEVARLTDAITAGAITPDAREVQS